ncbi:hypothetical protein H0H92_002604 [Tricholoma furcatifolium]|nr:hypothetical protein H0H92_002604 [Tricholoma furcatifolium]
MALLDGIAYVSPDSNEERRKRITETLRFEFAEHSNHEWFEEMCVQASAMAELAYHRHPVKEQLQIARFTWFMLYLDDLCSRFPASLQKFQLSILSNGDLEDPVLRAFKKHLTDMYRVWGVMQANSIISSAMEFINGCAFEELPELRNMKLSVNAWSWPYFLRAKTGVAAAYAFMIFPQSTNADLSEFIQTIGDISLFIDLANDLLS